MQVKTKRIEGKCDRTVYPFELSEAEEIYQIVYRDLSIPKPYGTVSVTSALSSYRIQPNAVLIRAGEPEERPETEGEAKWFVRACYEHTRRPIYYYFAPTQKLIVFPPPTNDGDMILIGLKQTDVESPQPDPTPQVD